MALGRFVVETHGHISTLYEAAGQEKFPKGWDGLPMAPGSGEVESVDNTGLTLWDMERYGVDMVLLYPSMIGTTNESQLALVDKYPDKFRAFCADQKTKLNAHRDGKPWKLQDAADEIEAALKTGRYIGIGEFIPLDWDRVNSYYRFDERFEEYCVFMDLARKYNVPAAFHDVMWGFFEWDPWVLLGKVATKYPDVPIIVNHGGHSIGSYTMGDFNIRKSLRIAGMPSIRDTANVYLEVGTWTAEMMYMAITDPNVGPTQLLWGSDYGNVPQYLTVDLRRSGNVPTSYSTSMKKWWPTPFYQCDWWGWEAKQIDRLKEWVEQDQINLILGGNAAKIFKLPVPYERMFLSGRPDVNGIHWKESVPYIPMDQVMYPDDKMYNKDLLEERRKNPPDWHK
ncbi:MAG: amidohydrolase family protein [Clostridiales Family XIII bacterium]|jgi:predicted TIM-barrel fold metal-dependent hydrolase|nr:amidohydrolase family protein [Clostridiales Family XIII bacterium]